tara:strand:- start:861 stop:1394 length:534 start_codon:yes stop_codon:yes gene_type:complete
MGKRSTFERKARDFYRTPYAAVVPLLPHLPDEVWFHEPCSGDGDLVMHLEDNGHVCAELGDISTGQDALEIYDSQGGMFITNPPWDRKILHPLILRLSDIAPTWLLFDADWMHTKQSAPFMERCQKIVSVGRVKWIPDSKMTGKDNCAWYLFTKEKTARTEFYGRAQDFYRITRKIT